jgi:hypothetical protein
MNNIQAIKVGNVVNVSLNGKLHKKNCGSSEEANELFKLVLNAKANPTEDNIKSIRAYLNEKLRVAFLTGLEHDIDSGEVFLAGFNTPIPTTLVEVIKEYHENGYPIDPIINFWKLLMANPDTRVRESLFDFINTHDFVLTDKGYMIVYKAVYLKNSGSNHTTSSFDSFITNQYLKVKKEWKTSPNRYVVYEDDKGNYKITKEKTAENWDNDIIILGKLGDIFNTIKKGKTSEIVSNDKIQLYTDMHTQTMTIQLGVPVKQARKECDADPRKDCSNGLHVGATKYVENFAGSTGVVLVCLVNPMNVVAVPEYDHSKMRVDEYFPFAVANYVDGKIEIIEQKYFEDDYSNIEVAELEKLIEKIQSEELPFEAAINAEKEMRPMSELKRIIQARITDVYENTVF